MSAPLTSHTLTTYHSHTIYHSYTHRSQSQLPFTQSPISEPLTSHTLTTYHSHTHTHTHPCQLHLPLTYSPLITHTLTYVSPTYHSHNYPCQLHLSLIHSFVENVLWFVQYVLVFRRNLVPLLHGLKAEAVLCLILVPTEEGQPSLATIFIVASLYFKIENQFRHALSQAIIGRPLIGTKLLWISGHYFMWGQSAGQSGTGTGFSPSTSMPSSQHPSAIAPYSNIFHLTTKPSINKMFLCFLEACVAVGIVQSLSTRYGLDGPGIESR